ncbi:MAG TPA: iron-containing alcohol dehydrogenase, partial [Candidatus Hydrogenedentes bacterium]|nr:iron-containing alcohol dehydrogenase [Candidatus Hydrogenedentota bacterium]
VTLNTGIDALSQAMEGMVARNSSALGDVLALDTIRLVKQWLPRAVADGHDLEARAQMLFAAMLSGCVIAQSGTTLVHGMGYLFTTGFGVAHGLANGFLLTPVFQFNAWHAPAKVAAMADALGFPAEPTPADAAAKIGAAVHALFKELGVSAAAKDAGVDGNRLDWCTEKVWSNRGRFANQIGEPSRDDVARMYRQAWEGAAYQPERN